MASHRTMSDSVCPEFFSREVRSESQQGIPPLGDPGQPALAATDGIAPSRIEDVGLPVLKEIAGQARGLQQVLHGFGTFPRRAFAVNNQFVNGKAFGGGQVDDAGAVGFAGDREAS